jgi:hypothetical protein
MAVSVRSGEAAMQPAVARFAETAPVNWWESCLRYDNLSLRRGATNCQNETPMKGEEA